MFKYRLLPLLLFIILTCSEGAAQSPFNFFFRHIGQSDGLLHNQALSIAQDRQGFIWITTANGLQRYDGVRFSDYPEMISDPNEQLTYTTHMYADAKKNALWITNNIKVEKMDLANGHFTVYNADSMRNDTAFHFREYKNGDNKLITIGQFGVYLAATPSGVHMPIHLNVMQPASHQSGFIAVDSLHHTSWAVTSTQLFQADDEKKLLYSAALNPQHHPLLDSSLYHLAAGYFRFILLDSRQNIWVSTWGDILLKYDAVTRKVSRFSLSAIQARQKPDRADRSQPLIDCMLEDDNQTIWVGTENAGLLRYDPVKDQFDYCITQQDDPEGIRYSYKIFSLFQDKDRNIWVGTDKGINIFNPYRQSIRTIRHRENDPQSIGKAEIMCFIQSTQGNMFIGTWGDGVSMYDSLFHFKKKIVPDGSNYNKFIWAFLQPDPDNLWIGCQAGKLLIYNLATGAIRALQPPELEKSTIRCMEKDGQGNIWFGLHNGRIVEWNKSTNQFLRFGVTGKDDKSDLLPSVFAIYIDPNQHFLVSTSDGFKEFDQEKRTFIRTYLPVKNDSTSISGKTIEGIEPYDDSTILLGTIFGGMNFFHTRTRTFSHLTMSGGLPSNIIYSIGKDLDGNIWFTTDYNLYKWDTASKRAIAYRFEPGIINSTFESRHFYRLRDGQWADFTSTELISFYPESLRQLDSPGNQLKITGFRLFDKPVHIDSLLEENRPVNLAYNQNFISIEFSALHFSGPEQINYSYRLEGIDKDWVIGDVAGFASYTDLPPGNYRFQVKGGAGARNRPAQQLMIRIHPPFWKTDLFLLLEALLLATILYALIKWRIYYVRKEAENKVSFMKQITNLEMQALRSQMNPHFIFNCINSIDALIQSDDKYRATIYLSKFAKLLRNILDSSKQNTVTLAKDLEALKLYIELEQLRQENKFTAKIIAGDDLLYDDYKVPPLIIQPFVENAILHGIRYRPDNKGLLTITIVKDNDYLKFTIEDNGVGRGTKNAQNRPEKSSYGIGLSNDRVKLFNNEQNASVKIIDLQKDGYPSGTKVELLLKIQ